MLDSPQLRGNVLSTITDDEYHRWSSHPDVRNLGSRDQVVFFQFYLTKGLIYGGYVNIESEALFWLFQNVLYILNGYVVYNTVSGGVISNTWLMSIVPSGDHIHFMFDSIVKERLILSKYDNVERAGF
jgi:hypothetical protein